MVMFLNSGGDKFSKSEKLINYISSNLSENKIEKEKEAYNKILRPPKDLSVQLIQAQNNLFKPDQQA